LFVLLVVCGSVAVVVVTREREPEYEGKTLNEWMGPAGLKVGWGYREQAVGHIGTNALLFLLQWIQYETPAWRKVIAEVGRRSYIPVFGSDATVEFERGENAVWCFEMLGADGRGAIPELLALTQAKRYRTKILAGKALAVMGADGVGALLGTVTNQPVPQDLDLNGLFWCWRTLGEDANRWVPVLLEQLKSTNGFAAGTSAVLLGLGHVQPEIVVPALSNAVYADDAWVRRAALNGLGEFGVQARPVAGLLVNALEDSDPNVRSQATNTLRRIAPEMLGKTGP
jgi:hypothetical protein